MSLKSELPALLTGSSGLSALIGTRLYPVGLPQNPVLPAVTYLQVSSNNPTAHDGPTDWERDRIQFDVYAATPLAAEAVADALSHALDQMRAVNSRSAGFEETRQDAPEPETGAYRVTLDAFIERIT